MSSLLYGLRPVEEALRVGRRRVRVLWVADGRESGRETLLRLAAERGVEVKAEPRSGLDRKSGHGVHQGVVAEVEPLPEVALAALLDRTPPSALLVVLDGVEDPQNLGAIVRTAACAGAQAVVVPRDRAASLTPAAIKVAEGAAEHVPVVTVTNLVRAMGELKDRGFWTYGFAESGSRAWHEVDLSGRAALAFGSEAHGLRRLVLKSCDAILRIPGGGPIGALNVAAAAAVGLFEAVRQRK